MKTLENIEKNAEKISDMHAKLLTSQLLATLEYKLDTILNYLIEALMF